VLPNQLQISKIFPELLITTKNEPRARHAPKVYYLNL
jgi:hypothetical protein